MNKNNSPYFAEIIESSLHTWLAQSWKWDEFPEFGSLVIISDGNRISYGIVCQIQTGSMDPGRYPFPYQKTEEELMREQPQIFEFLRTSFSCLSVGYADSLDAKPTIFYQLPPNPPKIHTFVRRATPEEHAHFFADERYVHLLFNFAHQIVNLEELLLALLKHRANANNLSQETLKTFTDTFSLLTGNDYRRLKLFLQRAQPLISNISK